MSNWWRYEGHSLLYAYMQVLPYTSVCWNHLTILSVSCSLNLKDLQIAYCAVQSIPGVSLITFTPVAAGRITGTHVSCNLSTGSMLMADARCSRCSRCTLPRICISICINCDTTQSVIFPAFLVRGEVPVGQGDSHISQYTKKVIALTIIVSYCLVLSTG